MNIAFVNPEYPSSSGGRDHGGIATYIYNLANAIAALGHTVHVLAKAGVIPDPLRENVFFHHFEHSPIALSLSATLRRRGDSVGWERGWSKGAKHVLLHLNGLSRIDIVEIPEYNGLAYEFGHGVPFPVVVHFHTPTSLVDDLNSSRVSSQPERWYRYEQAALRNASALKCPSHSLKQMLPRYCNPGAREVTVIASLMPLAFSERVSVQKAPWSGRRIDILFAGRLERRKGAEILLHGLNDILGIDERLHVTFAGGTDSGEPQAYRQSIERALRKEFRRRVWFLGALERTKLPALYRQSHIFLMPSLFENAPNSLFEAMAARLPIVATDVGGINEVIRHDHNGLLFPPTDRAKLVDCVRELLSSPEKADRLAQQAYNDIATMYDPELIARKTVDFYERVIGTTKPRRMPALGSTFRRLFTRLPIGVQIRLRRRISLLYDEAGYGDTLLVGAVAREIRAAYGRVHVTANRVKAELLRGNRYVNQIGSRYDGVDLNYHYGKHRARRGFQTNLLDIMCAKIGTRPLEHTVDIYLGESEKIYAREAIKGLARPIVTLQTTPGPFGADRKYWPHEYWVELTRRLVDTGCTVIQLGDPSEARVEGAMDRLGRQDIRQSIAIVSQADVHVGVVSCLMHAAEAVRTPAVILFGGFERYSAHNYRFIRPIESKVSCSPCAEPNATMENCPENNRCMRQIIPDMALEKVQEALAAAAGHPASDVRQKTASST